jgi:hypothetical protein
VPDGDRATFDGWHGSMKPEGRRTVMLLRAIVCPAHDDPERIIRQWPLQRLGLVPRCAHPNVPLLIGGQDHRHGLRMERPSPSSGWKPSGKRGR